jgi:uncharacterized protein
LETHKNRHGFTTISYAAYQKQPHIVNYLSLRFLNLDIEDPLGYTLIARLALSNSFETAARLITRGANVNYQNNEGKTALILAVIEDHIEAIKFLLEKGADPHI